MDNKCGASIHEITETTQVKGQWQCDEHERGAHCDKNDVGTSRGQRRRRRRHKKTSSPEQFILEGKVEGKKTEEDEIYFRRSMCRTGWKSMTNNRRS